MSSELDVFVDTTKTIHALDIPSRDKAEMLVRTALRMVLDDLADKNIEGAITTYNQYSSIEQYFKRQHADLVTQNTVAVGRLRLIRPIGKYIKKNYVHEPYLVDADRNRTAIRDEQKKIVNMTTTIPKGLSGKYLKDLPISEKTYLKWMDAAAVTEEEFEEWKKYYLDEDPKNPLKEEDDVHFVLFLKHFFSAKYGGGDDKINLLPHIKRAYNAWKEIIDAYQIINQELGKGETPVEQLVTLRDQMNKAIEVVNSTIANMKGLF